MSDTKYSSSGNPSDSWAPEFYNPGAFDGRDRISSESAAISTIAPGSMATNAPSHHGSSSSQYLNLPADQGGGGGGGRGSKPIRRRSRASRRTPTTLLNTDTANFRAMVQQFTGGPAAPYAAATASSGSHGQYPFPRGGSSSFTFGLDNRNQALNPSPPPSFYHLQFQQQQQRHHQQQQEQHDQYFQNQPQQPYMFSFMNNSRPEMEDASGHGGAGAGGFSMDHIPYSLPRPPSSMP